MHQHQHLAAQTKRGSRSSGSSVARVSRRAPTDSCVVLPAGSQPLSWQHPPMLRCRLCSRVRCQAATYSGTTTRATTGRCVARMQAGATPLVTGRAQLLRSPSAVTAALGLCWCCCHTHSVAVGDQLQQRQLRIASTSCASCCCAWACHALLCLGPGCATLLCPALPHLCISTFPTIP
jgi:hypothetical protein